MEQRALLAFIISLAILIGYQALFAPPPPQRQPADSTQAAPAPPARDPAPAQAPPPVLRRPAGVQEELVEVETEHYRLVVTSFGGRIKQFELKHYRTTADADSPPLDMVLSDSLLPLGLYWTSAQGGVASDTDLVYEIETDKQAVREAEEATITMKASTESGELVSKTLVVRGDSYVLDYRAEIDAAHEAAVGVAWARQVRAGQSRFAGTEGPVVFVDGELEAESAVSLSEPVHHQGLISWGGYAEHYFLAAYYPHEAATLRFVGVAASELGEAQLWADDAAGEVHYSLFVGPKRIHLLGALGQDLDRAVDLGWFTIVARPLLELMLGLHRVTGNYGWAILLLTAGIRVVFYPVNKKQANAMKAMQRIQPELKKLQEKYKDDRERLNKEMMETYRRHKVNPLAGCLPMVVQLPVFLGLYNALMQAIELRHAPFIGWITDLSQPDRLGTLPIPFVAPPGIPVMTLLMGASMFLQQKMTPAMGDPMQQRMMMFLPIVFTVMFINFPSGLVLYWLANNVMSIAQQYMTNRAKT